MEQSKGDQDEQEPASEWEELIKQNRENQWEREQCNRKESRVFKGQEPELAKQLQKKTPKELPTSETSPLPRLKSFKELLARFQKKNDTL